MATQKLFGEVPSGFSGIAGMVSPNITADITQKNPEDDASTLAGYKKRLELQSGQEAAAYQNKLNYQRALQQQWEQEDLKKEADMMRQLDASRKQAFDVIYRPQVESGIKISRQAAQGRAATSNQQAMNLSSMSSKPGVMTDPSTGMMSIPGFGLVGEPPVQAGQVQQALNTMYGRTMAGQQAQNTNPYYRPLGGGGSGGGGGPIGIMDPITGRYG